MIFQKQRYVFYSQIPDNNENKILIIHIIKSSEWIVNRIIKAKSKPLSKWTSKFNFGFAVHSHDNKIWAKL